MTHWRRQNRPTHPHGYATRTPQENIRNCRRQCAVTVRCGTRGRRSIDRLTFSGAIIETGTDSYRLAHTKNEQERRSKATAGS